MKQRLNFQEKGQHALKALYGLGGYLKNASIEQALRDLVYFRVSQINQCAFCMV